MRAHMRIESRSSVDYDGKRDLDIKTFVSDRDSDLTSNRAVALMMAARIKHDMAASGAKNQTPLLDNVIRRVQDVTRSLLDQSGLPEEYWEFAESVAVGIVNCFPTKSHPLNHSPMRRWTGIQPNLASVRTFGAEAYPHLSDAEMAKRDKLAPRAHGGDGRFRYLGDDRGLGYESRGGRIMDTTTGRVRVTRDYVLDEDMDRVRQQSLPRASRPQHAPVRAAKDEGPRVSFEDFASNKPEDELDEPIPDKGLSEPEDSDTDRPLTYEQNEGTGGAKGAPGEAKFPPVTMPIGDYMHVDQRISVQQTNPKSGKSKERYERYRHAETDRE